MDVGVSGRSRSSVGDRVAVGKPRRPVELRRIGPRPSTGTGRRLVLAFEALEAFPASRQSRDRLLAALEKDQPSADVMAAVESDVALVVGVLRLARSRSPVRNSTVDTVAGAVEQVGAEAMGDLASSVRTYDYFQSAGEWGSTPERFRLHALAVQRAAGLVARVASCQGRERLAVTSLLHDIGKLVLIHVHPDYSSGVGEGKGTPEERIGQERREYGVDHALVGSILLRRWGLAASLADPVARHHRSAEEDDGEATILRLGDMLAHYEQGASVSPAELLECAKAVGLGPKEVRELIFELSSPTRVRKRHVARCPLSRQELKVLRYVAGGSASKQIGLQLGITPSTVRSHLHKTYTKLDVVNGSQAVLLASRESWL
jgi:HD-like signal output (HDOD) protein/DNA-binding CsgD family transcriptional regulator